MSNKVIVVTSCADCPKHTLRYSEMEDDFFFRCCIMGRDCQSGAGVIAANRYGDKIPKWCPLQDATKEQSKKETK